MKKFNLKAKFIDENASLAQEILSNISIKIGELQKVVDFSTKKNINLLSDMNDEDIKSTLEQISELVDLLSNDLVYKK
jgi:hypothetical protein